MCLACAVLMCSSGLAAGPRTHVEMGWRAWDRFLAQMEPLLPGVKSFTNDRDAMRAFYCGCTFPDFAQDGIHDEAAEFAHWYDFQKAHFDYVKEHYPPPWDAEARRHVAFFFGVLCHGVGDIPWHFDEWGQQAFMNAAWAQDGESRQIEAAGDVFCHTRYLLDPPLAGQFWWPVDELREVFARAGVEVTLDQLTRGCKTQERDWRKGNTLGRIVFPYAWCAYPWTRRNLAEYYYGGLDNGAAYSAACIAHYHARLHNARYYQNILIQACAFPREKPFLPCTDTTLLAQRPAEACGGEPLLQLAPGGSSVLLRFEMADWPVEQPIGRATLALYCPERKGSRKALAVYKVNRPWLEGITQTAHGVESGQGATWLSTGMDGATWETPGCQGIPADRDAEPVALAGIPSNGNAGHWIQWDITPAVRHWAAHPDRNYGVLLQETPAGVEKAETVSFYSSQAVREDPASIRGGSCPAWHPILGCWP